jgi:hypothetical protein
MGRRRDQMRPHKGATETVRSDTILWVWGMAAVSVLEVLRRFSVGENEPQRYPLVPGPSNVAGLGEPRRPTDEVA